MCPDGNPSIRQCNNDSDCMFGDEMCAVGKCCSVCSQHRRQVLNNLPTNNVVGVHIPQCDPTGKHYRAVQCRTGTEECWCVSRYGRIIGLLKPKTADSNAACEILRLTVKRIMEEKRERVKIRRKQENLTSPKQESQSIAILSKGQQGTESKQQLQSINNEIGDKCLWMKSGRCPDQPASLTGTSKLCHCDGDCSGLQKCCPVLAGGLACSPNITISTDQLSAILHSSSTNSTAVCAKNEEFVECVNECKVSCSSRKSIPCFIERCKSGCQCKSGFIRQNDDFHARCIPENECPQQITEPEKRCIDPLREYKTCGSACPISCFSQFEKCTTEGCVEGCFCKVPYILENGSDSIHSRCILPVYCPLLLGDYSPLNATIHFVAMAPTTLNSHLFPEHRKDSITQPTVMRCSDPLKNFHICGSGCPGY
ncbi:hypothetical protein LOAG_11088 [Loa loa]|uniref:Thyroglobulin type-1 domain-containing protein n=1 Tax=Loa loa TaxID=7209 RepID=A0A1S0TNN2_LOALO|nr:hypothetical protein LOAG_11088 [Loa loa]EFO17411.1 hypothetical protein LOAG_11088 [Loa loa]